MDPEYVNLTIMQGFAQGHTIRYLAAKCSLSVIEVETIIRDMINAGYQVESKGPQL